MTDTASANPFTHHGNLEELRRVWRDHRARLDSRHRGARARLAGWYLERALQLRPTDNQTGTSTSVPQASR